jgi:hypothetical protein
MELVMIQAAQDDATREHRTTTQQLEQMKAELAEANAKVGSKRRGFGRR